MGEEKWSEYQKNRKNEKANRHRRRNADQVVNWRIRTKIKLISYKGGKCQICGYDKPYYSVYDFHHRNPSEKEFSVSGKTLAFETLKKEVDKCNLLCCRCHQEIHDKKFIKQRKKTIKEWKDWENNKIKEKECLYCKILFKPKRRKQKYCSVKCIKMVQTKVFNRPSKEQLLKEIEENNFCVVGRKYGVSDTAIRKWLE